MTARVEVVPLADAQATKANILGALRKLHGAMAVERRCLALPMEAYDDLRDFGAANDTFIRAGTDLGLALVVDAELFRLDSVIRWLDAADGRIRRAPADAPAGKPAVALRRRIGVRR